MLDISVFLTFVLIVLKLMGYITISWLAVFMPVIIVIAFILFILLLMYVIDKRF